LNARRRRHRRKTSEDRRESATTTPTTTVNAGELSTRRIDCGSESGDSHDEPRDAVEAALTAALRVATEAGDLEKIGAIVAELRERRQARAGVAVLRHQRPGRNT
jgi:hypothetical protein